jgi:hypothetical protein
MSLYGKRALPTRNWAQTLSNSLSSVPTLNEIKNIDALLFIIHATLTKENYKSLCLRRADIESA